MNKTHAPPTALTTATVYNNSRPYNRFCRTNPQKEKGYADEKGNWIEASQRTLRYTEDDGQRSPEMYPSGIPFRP